MRNSAAGLPIEIISGIKKNTESVAKKINKPINLKIKRLFEDPSEVAVFINELPPLNLKKEEREKKLINLLLKYKLPKYIDLDTIDKLVLQYNRGNIDNYIIFKGLDVVPGELLSKKFKGRLFIEIYPETTITDFQNNLLEINSSKEKYFNTTKKRSRESKNYNRDRQIYELKQQGKSNREIADACNIYSTDVSKILERYIKKYVK